MQADTLLWLYCTFLIFRPIALCIAHCLAGIPFSTWIPPYCSVARSRYLAARPTLSSEETSMVVVSTFPGCEAAFSRSCSAPYSWKNVRNCAEIRTFSVKHPANTAIPRFAHLSARRCPKPEWYLNRSFFLNYSLQIEYLFWRRIIVSLVYTLDALWPGW